MKFHRSTISPALGLILLSAGILQGCPGGAALENAEEHLALESCDAIPLFEERCSGSICHSAKDDGTVAGGVNLDPPGVAERMIDQPATYPGLEGDGCPEVPELLINSADPEKSLLMLKLTDTQTCGDGMPHPYRTSALSSQELACVQSWMEDALAGGGDGDGSGGQAGTGGDSGAGGSSAGGSPGSGGSDGSGGAASTGPIVIQAECAINMDCADGVTGSFTSDEAAVSDDGTEVGYVSTGTTFTYAGIMASGHQCLQLDYSKGNVEGESVTVYLTDAAGTELGSIDPIPSTGDWGTPGTLNIPLLMALTGTVTLHLVMGGVDYAFNLDSLTLLEGACP